MIEDVMFLFEEFGVDYDPNKGEYWFPGEAYQMFLPFSTAAIYDRFLGELQGLLVCGVDIYFYWFDGIDPWEL